MQAQQPSSRAPAARNASPRHARLEQKSKEKAFVPEAMSSKNKWFEAKDAETGKTYFYHGITMEVTWHDPRGSSQAALTARAEATANAEWAEETASQATAANYVRDANGATVTGAKQSVGLELPVLDCTKLRAMFDLWDRDRNGSIGEKELFGWMKTVNSRLSPTIETAQELIKAHDVDGNNELDYNEFEQWMRKGSQYSPQKRAQLRGKSDVHRHAINFLERLVMACPAGAGYTPRAPTRKKKTRKKFMENAVVISEPATASKPLPGLNVTRLKEEYARWDADKDKAIDVLELLGWMIELHSEPAPAPDTESARALVATHDLDGDQSLQWREFEAWIVKGAKLSVSKRNLYRRRGLTAHIMMNFLESLVWACSGEALPADPTEAPMPAYVGVGGPEMKVSSSAAMPPKVPAKQERRQQKRQATSAADMDTKTPSPQGQKTQQQKQAKPQDKGGLALSLNSFGEDSVKPAANTPDVSRRRRRRRATSAAEMDTKTPSLQGQKTQQQKQAKPQNEGGLALSLDSFGDDNVIPAANTPAASPTGSMRRRSMV
jgi:hypothetical protein